MRTNFILVIVSIGVSGCTTTVNRPWTEISPLAVESTTQMPVEADKLGDYGNVCQLKIYRSYFGIGKSEATGSGVLIGDRHVLTAAHNIFSPIYRPVKYIDVRCGLKDAANAGGVSPVRVVRRHVAKGYRWGPGNGDEFQIDYGLVELASPAVGLVPAGLADQEAAVNDKLTIVGFPADGQKDARFNGETMFSGTGIMGSRDRNRIRYTIKTAGGNSGGPVFDKNGKVAAVHVTNFGGRIVDEAMRRKIRDWMK